MRKNLIAIEIVGILLLSCLAITPAFGVSGSGNTLYVGGGGPGNYTKIQYAIDNASNGDTVYVYNGIYYENIVVNKAISLVGKDKDTTIIDGEASTVIYVTANYVNISGFTIFNATADYNDGIYLKDCSFNSISDCKIYSNGGNGIRLYNSDNNEITNCILYNNQYYYGIFLINSSWNTISDCNIYHNVGAGVFLWVYSNNNTIKNCSISNNLGNGIQISHWHWDESKDNNITNNNIIDNLLTGVALSLSNYNTITSNNISNNNCGIEFYSSGNNTINYNDITNNMEYGIYLNSSDDNIISENNIISNGKDPFIGYGLVISYLSNKDNIYHNNFIGNKHNASDSCDNIWDNGYPSGGNYWDDYAGTDANYDGIGDTPYNISAGSNKDHYPLMKPFGENPPVADFTYKVNKYTVTFTSLSYDRDGKITNYTWTFGDGKGSFEQNLTHTYAGEYTPYNVTLNVTDNDGRKDTIYKHITTNDTTTPTIQIIKPERALYIGNHKIRRLFLRMALIIGDITVEVNATDINGSGMAKVEFYINGKFKGNDTTAPYTYNLTKDRILRFVHMQIIKVVAYDKAGNKAEAKMIVRKFL